MKAYRLARDIYAKDLSGAGAQKVGGRWNSPGKKAVYVCEHRATCLAEMLVHLPFSLVPTNYVMAEIEWPDSLPIQTLKSKDLPNGWNSFPFNRPTQLMGDAFLEEARHFALQVPSAVVEGEFNFLINPAHPDIARCTVIRAKPFAFDQRLFLR